MNKLSIGLIFSFIFAAILCADELRIEGNCATKSTEYTNFFIEAPAKLTVTGASFLDDVTVNGDLVVNGQEILRNQFSGVKLLDFPVAGTATGVLTFAFNADPLAYPIYLDLRYIAKVATIKGNPQVNKTFFCKLILLLNSSTVWATLEKTVYVNGAKDGTASVTPTISGNLLKISFQDYTMVNGTLFYNVYGVNVTGVS